MDGMLSQDEINALLNGVDLSADDKGSAAATTATVDSSEEGLTDVEKDAIGEVANISMGTSATTLYSLVNRKVNITTPVVEMTTWEEVMTNYENLKAAAQSLGDFCDNHEDCDGCTLSALCECMPAALPKLINAIAENKEKSGGKK